MGRNVVAICTLLLFILCTMLPQGATAVIRRTFFPGNIMRRDDEHDHLPIFDNYASKKYCVEPCTTMVQEASAKCHSCVLAHPLIPRYMEMMQWQFVSDVLIALAYFSIPAELLFFIYKAQVFPYKWVVAEFGAFIVLCGLTHVMNIWTFEANAANATRTMTFFKVAAAFVSCATAVTLSWVIPEILSVKKNELYLAKKTAELHQKVGVMTKKEETGKYVRMLTSEIRSTLNRHTILKTTLVELAQTLKLNNCNILMPNEGGESFQLTHDLLEMNVTSAVPHTIIPRTDPGVLYVRAITSSNGVSSLSQSSSVRRHMRSKIGVLSQHREQYCSKALSQQGAVLVPPDSLVGRHNCPDTEGFTWEDRVVAVKLPYMSTSNFKETKDLDLSNGDLANGHLDAASSSYALLVLVLPCEPERKWHDDELDVVTAIAGQVAVALSHATVLEESMKSRDQLMSQNLALQIARMEAEEAVAARNDFLAVMNHEMRTPMHSLIALTSILLKTDLDDDQRAMIETMNKSSGLLSSLINDILDFSRLETGGLALDIGLFKLPNLMREVENIVRPLATSKKISLIMSLPPDLPENVLGDSNRILQVMLNVIGNAIKFTLEGEVRVSVRTGERAPTCSVTRKSDQPMTPSRKVLEYRYVHVDIIDSGIGINAVDVPRLFNKFVQADSSTTRKFGGTGLGLAISRKFVELMGGKVCLESEGLGKGTTCKMYISLGIPDSEKPKRLSPRLDLATISELTNLKVMVVDDNPINRIVTRRLLDTIGCKSTVLDSGQRCLDILTEKGPSEYQVILLDLCMPEMDGFTVATEINKKYGRTNRPVISALTANSDTKTRQRCFEVGMDYVLMKPINLELLKSELSKLVDFHEELNFQDEYHTPLHLVRKSDEAGSSKEISDYDIAPHPTSETADEAGSSKEISDSDSPAPQLLLPPLREPRNNKHK